MTASRWGNTDLVSNTSKQYALTTFNQGAAGIANGSALWQNTTPGAFTNGQVVSLYGVTKTMLGVSDKTTAGKATSSPGWVLVKQGTGGVATAVVNAPGGAPGNIYSNTDYAVISATGAVSANVSVKTNATGNLASASITTPGFGFPNTSVTTTTFYAANGAASNGTGGSLTITIGGRSGRVQTEVLVVTPTMQSACSTTLFPNT
jgi:hypothetical protein